MIEYREKYDKVIKSYKDEIDVKEKLEKNLIQIAVIFTTLLFLKQPSEINLAGHGWPWVGPPHARGAEGTAAN